jgi:hypothetical protein
MKAVAFFLTAVEIKKSPVSQGFSVQAKRMSSRGREPAPPDFFSRLA